MQKCTGTVGVLVDKPYDGQMPLPLTGHWSLHLVINIETRSAGIEFDKNKMIQKPLRRGIPNDLIDVQKRSAIFLNTPREKLVFPNVLISPTLPCPLTSWTILESLLKYKSNFGHRVFSAVCEPNKQLDQFG